MRSLAKAACLLWAATALACAVGPRMEIVSGASRQFEPSDRFAPAPVSVLGTENPDFPEPELETLHELLGGAIGWRGLELATEEDADWLVSCAFRKRIVFKGDPTIDPIVQTWRPLERRPRRMGGTGTEYQTRGAVDPTAAKPPEPWIDTIVELRLRSRRTGTIGWAVQRLWGRDRSEMSEEELKETLDVLFDQLVMAGETAAPPADRGR